MNSNYNSSKNREDLPSTLTQSTTTPLAATKTRLAAKLEKARQKREEIRAKIDCATAEKCQMWETIDALSEENLQIQVELDVVVERLDAELIRTEAIIRELEARLEKNELLNTDKLIAKHLRRLPAYVSAIAAAAVVGNLAGNFDFFVRRGATRESYGQEYDHSPSSGYPYQPVRYGRDESIIEPNEFKKTVEDPVETN